MNLNITKATNHDISALIEMNHELFLHDYPFDKFLNKEWPYSESGQTYFSKAVTDESYWAYVAKDENIIVGYLIGYIWDHWDSRPVKTAEIDNMFVFEEYRGKKVGRALVDEFIKWCKSKEVKDVVVMAYTDNDNAIEFYKKTGFKDLSVRLHQSLE